MNPYIVAGTADQLDAALIADCGGWDKIGLPKKQREERAQIGHFLRARAATDIQFPLSVTHVLDTNPDFQIVMAGKTIGVEVTSNASEAMGEYKRNEEVRSSWTSPTPFLVPYSKKIDGPIFPASQNLTTEWNSAEDEDRFWWDQTRSIIIRKTTIRSRGDFRVSDENWLLLRDDLTLRDLRSRWEFLSKGLAGYWKLPCRYDVIALEDDALVQFAAISSFATRFYPE